MSKRDNPEQRLQIAVAQYLAHALKPPTIWTAFPAGGGGKVRGAFLKAMGLKAGWPDILILHPDGDYAFVLGIELKAGKGALSPNQKAIHAAIWGVGGVVHVCRSLEDVQTALRSHLIPLSATVARAAA